VKFGQDTAMKYHLRTREIWTRHGYEMSPKFGQGNKALYLDL